MHTNVYAITPACRGESFDGAILTTRLQAGDVIEAVFEITLSGDDRPALVRTLQTRNGIPAGKVAALTPLHGEDMMTEEYVIGDLRRGFGVAPIACVLRWREPNHAPAVAS